ncbi:hypothetical protein CHU_3265 [Sporocytophaga myxococcoides]|uniref:Uncharacterized protein n=1 Tax=Sporocytophaga myxococcoides TaxID=153721 RepID=A0A098LD51_9BACT|nr:hypothetical protein [Sporocytophaga myxococcoides]GAL84337.1 hypothetical protein CHU_3265 [Sporocytophaga myxococcoides]
MKTFNILIIFLFVLFVSCRKEFEKPRWDAGILAPLIKTKLGIGDIIKDSVIQRNPDNSLKIVNRELLYSLTLDSLLNLGKQNFPEYNTSRKLSELKLDSKTFSHKITLKQLADQPGNEHLKQYVEQQNGPVPAISGINLPPIPLPTGLFFTEADIKEGNMEITVNNEFPFSIDSVNFRLTNASGNNIYYNEVFRNLTPGTPQVKATDLAGKKIEGSVMNAYVQNMATIGVGNVPYMDPNSTITVTINISDVMVNSATAVFPAQNVIDDSNYVYLVSMGDVKLTEAKLRSGNVRVEVTSTAQDNIYFTYDIPGAIDKAGTRFKIEDVVPPNQAGKPFVKEYDLAGYILSLKGMNSKGEIRDTTYNAFFNKITGRIEYTGRLIFLSLNDSMSVKISMENMVPEYVRGYLGQYSVTETGTAAVDLFKKVTGGELKFEEITNIGIKVENGIGVSGFVDVSSIKGSRPGATPVEIKNLSTVIEPAIETPLQSVTSTLSLGTKDKDLLNLMPHSIDYQVHAFANKDVEFSPQNTNQFAYYGSPLNIFLDMEVPLNLLANKLQLSDTIEFLTKEMEASVKSGYLNLIANNGFPISANLKLYFLDANKNLTDSLISPDFIKPAPINGDKAVGKSQSIIKYNLSNENSIQNILHSKYMVFKAVFDTQPAEKYYKIYSDYELDVTISGNVNVTIE